MLNTKGLKGDFPTVAMWAVVFLLIFALLVAFVIPAYLQAKGIASPGFLKDIGIG